MVLRAAGGYFDVCIDGVNIRLHPAYNSTERALLVRGADAEAVGLTHVLPSLQPGDVFVDLGANSGIFTIFAAKRVGPEGRVLAVEPMPEMLENLRFNVCANSFANVAIFPTAVGACAGTATLRVHPKNRGASSLTPYFDGTDIQVPVSTLAGIVSSAGVNRIDLLKIDIEGFEDRALVPFIDSMPRRLWPKRIFMETRISHRWEQDCVKFLLDAGYITVWQDPTDISLELRRAGRRHGPHCTSQCIPRTVAMPILAVASLAGLLELALALKLRRGGS
jgi:FkbM family methyltransferase